MMAKQDEAEERELEKGAALWNKSWRYAFKKAFQTLEKRIKSMQVQTSQAMR